MCAPRCATLLLECSKDEFQRSLDTVGAHVNVLSSILFDLSSAQASLLLDGSAAHDLSSEREWRLIGEWKSRLCVSYLLLTHTSPP